MHNLKNLNSYFSHKKNEVLRCQKYVKSGQSDAQEATGATGDRRGRPMCWWPGSRTGLSGDNGELRGGCCPAKFSKTGGAKGRLCEEWPRRLGEAQRGADSCGSSLEPAPFLSSSFVVLLSSWDTQNWGNHHKASPGSVKSVGSWQRLLGVDSTAYHRPTGPVDPSTRQCYKALGFTYRLKSISRNERLGAVGIAQW